ncbi:DUF4380 domain-containing protein [Photobacterium sagamiensis]|uniref:DUF4380 domain-containing protein n=1 Tax=Photobacterium sagamiensis TaxID=2910241 RepID=UPI003D0B0DDB
MTDKHIAPQIKYVSYESWNSYQLKNDLISLQVVPDIGGRISQFSLGEKDFFYVNPLHAGVTSPVTGLSKDNGHLNFGGDKIWLAPQGWDSEEQWPGPPCPVLDGKPYNAIANEDDTSILLTSGDDHRSGIRLSRKVKIFPNSTRVSIESSMLNIGTKPRRWGIWAHTQLDATNGDEEGYNELMRAWCPINPNSQFKRGYGILFGEEDNPSWITHEDTGLIQVDYFYKVGKIGLDSPNGWVATVDGKDGKVFVQCFEFEEDIEYPNGASVEFWHNGTGQINAYNDLIDMPDDPVANPYIFESEVVSPMALMNPGEKYTYFYDWYSCSIGGDYPVIDCTEAGVTSEPLMARRNGAEVDISGRFGVFSCGKLEWCVYDDAGNMIQNGLIEDCVSPINAIVINKTITAPLSASKLVISLKQDHVGESIVLASCKVDQEKYL